MTHIKTFSYNDKDEDIIKKCEELAHREGYRGFSQWLMNVLEDHVKKHGDGNPQFLLEQFQDPNFVACPAFYRDEEAWKKYLAQATPEELEKVKEQVIMIDRKLVQYL